MITNNKTVAYALEAGPQSITRQVERLGLCVLVVDRDGSVYGPQAWPESMTFRQGDQEGLLVADRRTLEYERGDVAQRRLMAATSWGPSADPPTLATEARSPGGGPTKPPAHVDRPAQAQRPNESQATVDRLGRRPRPCWMTGGGPPARPAAREGGQIT